MITAGHAGRPVCAAALGIITAGHAVAGAVIMPMAGGAVRRVGKSTVIMPTAA